MKLGKTEISEEEAMWKRINPNVEYIIAAMRKKGEDAKNGISKVRRPEESKSAVKMQRRSCS
jgi:hypothetical protein